MNVFFDLDGVLANYNEFVMHMKASQHYKDYDKVYNIQNRVDFWKYASLYYSDMWIDLPVIASGLQLWDSHIKDNRVVLTALPAEHINAFNGKRMWVDRVLGDHISMMATTKGFKHTVCNSGDILYDDDKQNINDWNYAGGKGVLIT